jgi:hypothetical protein
MRRARLAPARSAALPAALACAALALAACGPKLPKGVNADRLNETVSDAIGDPNTCVLIGKSGSGAVVWRYNSHTTCARSLPACDAPGARTVEALLKATAADGRPRMLSCNSTADASRGVGWASAPIAGRGLVYAAVMEGPRALPGRIMAEKMDGALKDAGF